MEFKKSNQKTITCIITASIPAQMDGGRNYYLIKWWRQQQHCRNLKNQNDFFNLKNMFPRFIRHRQCVTVVITELCRLWVTMHTLHYVT